MDKAVTWVKDNPGTSLVITGVAAFAVYQLVKPKATGLSGLPPNKRKKKRKKTPAQLPAISGTQKPRKHKPKKGGGSKKYKL